MDINEINGIDLARLVMREVHGCDEEPPAPAKRTDVGGGPTFGEPEEMFYDHDWAVSTLMTVEHTYHLHRERLDLPHLFDANIKKVVFDREPDIEFEATGYTDGLLKAALIVWRRLMDVERVALKKAPKRSRR
ncbi:hypothetical protein OAU50_08435 [Planctomycetota bacterium]|nr:hypothetical protein [Planctomycetota bacterium]